VDYLDSDTLKGTLSLTGYDFADDDVAVAISAASEAIDSATGTTFGPTDDDPERPVPARVTLACSILASRYIKRLREAPFGIAGVGADGAVVRIMSVDPDVRSLLDPLATPLIG
jgi:hypothetical protein